MYRLECKLLVPPRHRQHALRTENVHLRQRPDRPAIEGIEVQLPMDAHGDAAHLVRGGVRLGC
eukprot:CAMPEP_0183591610 /NCGR_PEP_ID=MMETSP0371-20130417/166596_1 /TAXON_ID=268820 /ORGANISM="Peridinium aciculiferum, Strain PAER-2" /LENGTH=62 /DNA_ID=CAMNT_0025803095 /DNA_START=53 /DNA_END=238 /DNA_ORIENTATION=-